MASRNILLMTATITPRDSPLLARTDPAVRLEDYRAALACYLPQVGTVLDGIVFVENSDSDVSSLAAAAQAAGVGDRVEFIANYGIQSFPGRDRSFGESRLLDHAMSSSRLIAEAGDDAVVWKVTGRYQVVNLRQMIATAPKRFDIYCDIRRRPLLWCDLRLMAWTKRGYESALRDTPGRIGSDPIEPAMYHHLMERDHGVRVVPRYRREPLVDGVRGWDNRHYSEGRARLKYLIRATARRVTPFIWI